MFSVPADTGISMELNRYCLLNVAFSTDSFFPPSFITGFTNDGFLLYYISEVLIIVYLSMNSKGICIDRF